MCHAYPPVFEDSGAFADNALHTVIGKIIGHRTLAFLLFFILSQKIIKTTIYPAKINAILRIA